MDTHGRTTLTVTAMNLMDEARMKAILVSTTSIQPTYESHTKAQS